MGRSYAGVLGSLAFTTVVVRAVLDGAAAEPTLRTAGLCLVAFAALGWILGQTAEFILLEALQARFQEELQTQQRESSTGAPDAARR